MAVKENQFFSRLVKGIKFVTTCGAYYTHI